MGAKLPLAFMTCFFSYAMILFIEKVAFNSHSLIDHDHGHGDGHSHDHEVAENFHDHSDLEEKNEKLLKEKQDEEEEEEEEDALKAVLTTKGRFSSFIMSRNEDTRKHAIEKANEIIKRTMNETKFVGNQQSLFVDPEQVDQPKEKNPVNISQQVEKATQENLMDRSISTAYLLLIALSIHGLFEGIALGIGSNLKEVGILLLSIIIHKWAESFTLVIF